MNAKKFNYLAAVALAIGLAHSALAQPAGQTNYQWSAAGDKTTWSQGANWTQGVAPLTDGTTYAIDMWVNSSSKIPITIGASDTVSLNDSLFGPLWGQTLNVQGPVTCGWGLFIWGDSGSGVSTMNVTNTTLSVGDTIALGTAWWFAGGPNVALNVYSNALVSAAWMQFGGHLNIHGGGTVSVTSGFNTGTATTPVFAGGADTDATRAINLETNATLVLPASYTATVNDWISRGILQVYGAPASASDIVIDEANANWPGRTVVTTTASGPSVMVAVQIEVPRTNLSIGGLEQARVFADYTTSTHVEVTTTATNLVYRSSATNVVTVATNGLVRAVGLGSATVTAIIGTLSNSVAVTVAAYTNNASLVHRYSFAESSGSTAADSIGGVDWDGTLMGGAAFNGGQVVLDSTGSSYVQLPAGIITNLDAVTIEAWVTLGSTITNWACLYAFGDQDSGTLLGRNYVTCQPHTRFTTAQIGLSDANPGYNHEQDAWFAGVLDGRANLHVVAVYHPEVGYTALYTNGVLAAINNNVTITLASALGTDPLNYIGRSLYNNDPYIDASVDEFRIYNGPLTAGQVMADYALGANQLIGTSTNVSLSASMSGGSLVVSWPTTSALVTLLSSPTLGSGAVWTPVNVTYTVVGGNYRVILPTSSSAQFFRLQK